MNARRWAQYAAIAVLVAILLGCVSPKPSSTTSAPSGPSPSLITAATPTPTQRADEPSPTQAGPPPTPPSDCPVTIGANGPAELQQGLFGWSSAYGNAALWVGGLWPNGVIVPDPRWVDANGATGIKFGWWRYASGKLTITGRRLDLAAPPATGDVPDGYGDSGFQATGVIFPTTGCWEITGTVDGVDLTFVTFVVDPPA
jgi:hypothetical protein